MQFQWADSLFACGQKADLCKKYAVTKISSLTTGVYLRFFRQFDSARTLGSRGYFFSYRRYWWFAAKPCQRGAKRREKASREPYQTVSTVYFILGILRTDLWKQGIARAEREKKRKKPFPTPTPLAFVVNKSHAVFIIIRALTDI